MGIRKILSTENENCIIGSSLMKTVQESLESIESIFEEPGGLNIAEQTISIFPLAVESYYKQDEITMEMKATLLYKYTRQKTWRIFDSSNGKSNNMTVLWSNNMGSNATYNRIPDHATMYAELEIAHETLTVSQKAWTRSRKYVLAGLIPLKMET